MNSLNDQYNKSCSPIIKNYTKISSDIILIDDFFENFNVARKFFLNRDKWKCISYQNNSKSGYISLFPNWVGKSLLEKFILDHKIIDDVNSYSTVCSFSYEENSFLWSIHNSSYYPHIDSIQIDQTLTYICLVNLSETIVATNFYTYKNQELCNEMIYTEWEKYSKDIWEELLEYYGKKFVTKKELKNFLSNKKQLEVKLAKKVDYGPNQAIVYPANLFHSPYLDSKFTEENPRSLLRITFDKKISLSKNNFFYS